MRLPPGIEHWEVRLSLLSTDLLRPAEILLELLLWNSAECRPGKIVRTFKTLAVEINDTPRAIRKSLGRLRALRLIELGRPKRGEVEITVHNPDDACKYDVRFEGGPYDGGLMRLPLGSDSWSEEIALAVKSGRRARYTLRDGTHYVFQGLVTEGD